MSGEADPDPELQPAGEQLAPADVEAIVAELRAEVERKRTAGEYPTALLERLHTQFHPDEGMEPPEVSVLVESARPLRSTRRLVGPAIVFGKRAVRRLLAWYVAPIARDQTRFNLAILRELRGLERRLEALERSPTLRPDQPEPEGRPRARP